MKLLSDVLSLKFPDIIEGLINQGSKGKRQWQISSFSKHSYELSHCKTILLLFFSEKMRSRSVVRHHALLRHFTK